MDNDGVRAITSLRWPNENDVPLFWHQDRLLACASALNWKNAEALLSLSDVTAELEKAIENHLLANLIDRTRMYKVTIHISSDGHITVSSAPLTGPLYEFHLLATTLDDGTAAVDVYISPHATSASVFTMHKTSLRNPYNQAREAVSISNLPPTTAEVLLYNEENEITEASLSTVYFQRGNTWITPHADSGCNLGLTRKLALDRNWCQEGRILRFELHHGEMVRLSNCVRGFWSGRVVLHSVSSTYQVSSPHQRPEVFEGATQANPE